MYQCPRCDRLLTDRDYRTSKCDMCGLEFTVKDKAGIDRLQKRNLVEMFAEEINRNAKKKINYRETITNILKTYLGNIVIFRRPTQSSVFLVEDMEIKCLLFKISGKTTSIKLFFDTIPKYRGVVKMSPSAIIKIGGNIRSYIDTKDFELVMDIASSLFRAKRGKYRDTKRNDSNLYIYMVGNDKKSNR